MTAIAGPRMTRETSLKEVQLLLAAGAVAQQGEACCIDTAVNFVKPPAGGVNTLVSIGEFLESVDNSAGTGAVLVNVSLDMEIWVRWYDNATGGGAIAEPALGKTAYWLDNNTLTGTAGGNSKAGRVWFTDPVNGVAIQKVDPASPALF